MPWWVPLVAAAIGAVLGFGGSLFAAFMERRRRIRSCWRALFAEFQICSQMAQDYLGGRKIVMSPVYRWPLVAYVHTFPELLLSAGMSTGQARAILDYFLQVDALNRGLDEIQEHLAVGRQEGLNRQFRTNRLKAAHLRSNSEKYTAARKVFAQFSV